MKISKVILLPQGVQRYTYRRGEALGAKAEAETAPAARMARTFMVKINWDTKIDPTCWSMANLLRRASTLLSASVCDISNVHANQTSI